MYWFVLWADQCRSCEISSVTTWFQMSSLLCHKYDNRIWHNSDHISTISVSVSHRSSSAGLWCRLTVWHYNRIYATGEQNLQRSHWDSYLSKRRCGSVISSSPPLVATTEAVLGISIGVVSGESFFCIAPPSLTEYPRLVFSPRDI